MNMNSEFTDDPILHDECYRFVNNINIIKTYLKTITGRNHNTRSILKIIEERSLDDQMNLTTNEILEDVINRKILKIKK